MAYSSKSDFNFSILSLAAEIRAISLSLCHCKREKIALFQELYSKIDVYTVFFVCFNGFFLSSASSSSLNLI